MAKSKTFKIGRDTKTGQFIPVKKAERRKSTTVVERIPKAGYGSDETIKTVSRKRSRVLRRLAKK